ncbi:MAG TPA: hypothetical protein VFA41_16785 [Ktedonobacteraceae bacterium]|jgi:hypothetical protein|nr:hypothetical protein [Ktedonobacteraceae bacterium]
MPICPICDDSGLQNSDSEHPEFCYCSAGKQARRQWEASQKGGGQGKNAPKPASFIDIAHLEEVNASVDAMRASLLGSLSSEASAPTRHPAVQLLFQVAHANHEVTVAEATQLYELAKALETFLGGLAPIGRNLKR